MLQKKLKEEANRISTPESTQELLFESPQPEQEFRRVEDGERESGMSQAENNLILTPNRELQRAQEFESPDPVIQVRQVEDDERLARILQEEANYPDPVERVRQVEDDERLARMLQEVAPRYPDPVEQVRQIEDDERMSRILQAQFNAEVEPDTPAVPSAVQSQTYRGEVILPSDSKSIIRINYPHPAMTPPGPSRPSGMSLSHVVNIHETSNSINRALPVEVGGEGNRTHINKSSKRKYEHPNPASSSSSSKVGRKRARLEEECSVCLADYDTGGPLRLLPCSHVFHKSCIDQWLRVRRTCPICRVSVRRRKDA